MVPGRRRRFDKDARQGKLTKAQREELAKIRQRKIQAKKASAAAKKQIKQQKKEKDLNKKIEKEKKIEAKYEKQLANSKARLGKLSAKTINQKKQEAPAKKQEAPDNKQEALAAPQNTTTVMPVTPQNTATVIAETVSKQVEEAVKRQQEKENTREIAKEVAKVLVNEKTVDKPIVPGGPVAETPQNAPGTFTKEAHAATGSTQSKTAASAETEANDKKETTEAAPPKQSKFLSAVKGVATNLFGDISPTGLATKAITGIGKGVIKAHKQYTESKARRLEYMKKQRETAFKGYTANDYLRDTNYMSGYRAKTRDLGSRLFNNVSFIEEAIKRQNKIAEEHIQYMKKRDEERKRVNPNVNTSKKQNEYGEKIDIFGDVYREDVYRFNRDGTKSRHEYDIETRRNAGIYADRETSARLDRKNIDRQMAALTDDRYHVAPLRDKMAWATRTESREVNDLENITIISHPEYYKNIDLEHQAFFNTVSQFLNGGLEIGKVFLNTLNAAGGVVGIINTGRKIFEKLGVVNSESILAPVQQKLIEFEKRSKEREVEIDNRRKVILENQELFKELALDSFNNIKYVNIEVPKLGNISKMTDKDIDEYARQWESLGEKISTTEKMLSKLKDNDKYKEYVDTIQEYINKAKEYANNPDNSREIRDYFKYAYDGGYDEEEYNKTYGQIERNREDSYKKMTEQMKKHMLFTSKRKTLEEERDKINRQYEAQLELLKKSKEDRETIKRKRDAAAKEFNKRKEDLDKEIKNIDNETKDALTKKNYENWSKNIGNVVNFGLEAAKAMIQGEKMEDMLMSERSLLDPQFLSIDDRPEYTLADRIINLRNNTKLKSLHDRTDLIVKLNQLAGDWRILPENEKNPVVRDALKAYLRDDAEALGRLKSKGINSINDIFQRKNVIYQYIRLTGSDADPDDVFKRVGYLPAQEFRQRLIQPLIEKKAEKGFKAGENIVATAMMYRDVVKDAKNMPPELMTTRIERHQSKEGNTEKAAYNRLWEMARHILIGESSVEQKELFRGENLDQDKLRNKMISSYSSIIHTHGTAAPEVEKDILRRMKDIEGLFKDKGQSIFSTRYLKNSANVDKAWERIFRAAEWRRLYLLKHNIPIIDDRFAETMTANTGTSTLARTQGNRYLNNEKMVKHLMDGKMIMGHVTNESILNPGEQYEREQRRGIARAILDKDNHKMAHLLNQIDNPQYIRNDELLELSRNIDKLNEEDIIRTGKKMNEIMNKRRSQLTTSALNKHVIEDIDKTQTLTNLINYIPASRLDSDNQITPRELREAAAKQKEHWKNNVILEADEKEKNYDFDITNFSANEIRRDDQGYETFLHINKAGHKQYLYRADGEDYFKVIDGLTVMKHKDIIHNNRAADETDIQKTYGTNITPEDIENEARANSLSEARKLNDPLMWNQYRIANISIDKILPKIRGKAQTPLKQVPKEELETLIGTPKKTVPATPPRPTYKLKFGIDQLIHSPITPTTNKTGQPLEEVSDEELNQLITANRRPPFQLGTWIYNKLSPTKKEDANGIATESKNTLKTMRATNEQIIRAVSDENDYSFDEVVDAFIQQKTERMRRNTKTPYIRTMFDSPIKSTITTQTDSDDDTIIEME